MAVTKDITATKIQAETQDYVERLRIQREEGQYSMHKQTQTQNIGAFQVEKQAEVGVAGAQALGQMGANGAGDVNLGGNGDGFNMAAMMASMAVGGAGWTKYCWFREFNDVWNQSTYTIKCHTTANYQFNLLCCNQRASHRTI